MAFTKQMFFRYLKEKNIYNSFFKNLKNSVKNHHKHRLLNDTYNGDINIFLRDYFYKKDFADILIDGFTWDLTPEGPSFWHFICSDLYQMQYGKKNIRDFCF